jgi:acid stress chaperone HdeA
MWKVTTTNAAPAAVVLAAAVLAAVVLAGTIGAAEAKKASEWTCQDFLAVSEGQRAQVVYWMEGYNAAGKPAMAEVDVEDFSRPIATVVTECQKDPKASLWDKIKNFFSNL